MIAEDDRTRHSEKTFSELEMSCIPTLDDVTRSVQRLTSRRERSHQRP